MSPTAPKINATLSKRLTSFRKGFESLDENVTNFFAPNADAITPDGFLVGRESIQKRISQAFKAKADEQLLVFKGSSVGEVTSVRQLTSNIAIVDGFIPGENGDKKSLKGWFSEVWKNYDGEFLIACSRNRVGSAAKLFSNLQAAPSRTSSEDITEKAAVKEEEALRALFVSLRKAWKSGDAAAMGKGLHPTADAIPSFGFLENRSQILQGREAVVAKMTRLNPQAVARLVPGFSGAKGGALQIAGEAKSIRFLGPNVAVVDGTIELQGIPQAHGFAPSQLSGFYTDYWRKSGSDWRIEGTRPWF
jgi:hypothetical protein